MTESDWMHGKIPPDLTPRLVVHGGPVEGPLPGDVDPNQQVKDSDGGRYEKFEFRGGAFWQWKWNDR